MRILHAFLAVPAFAFAALAAPVPFPREVADVVIRIENKAGSKTLVDRLRSRAFAAEALKGESARNLNCVKGNTDAAAGWRRLKVKALREGESLRISLENCPAKEARALLSAVLEACLDEIQPTRLTLRRQMKTYQAAMERCVQRMGAGNAERIMAIYQERIMGCQQRLQKIDEGVILQKPRLLRSDR